MNEIHTDPVLDMKTLFAIYTDPDGVSIIGAWNGVKMLAASDPEGCVRMTSGLPMDTAMLAGLFHCSECIVQKTLSLFEKLRLLTVTDGLIRIAGCKKDSATNQIATSKNCESKETEAHKRELARLRQAERRARQKQEKEQQKENVAAIPDEKCDEARDENRDMCDNVRDRHAVTRDRRDKVRDMRDTQRDNPTQNRMNTASADSVTERDKVRDMRDTGNTVNSNINNNLNALNTLNALKADKHLSTYETENEKVNKHPEENGQKIPLNLLPEPIRNVIKEYNKLPLPKYNGIIPSLLEKMKYLLHRYGERIVIKTIAGIANSTFLLGKKENSSWTASLSWLMDAKNFAKVYAGKYSNNTDGSCDKNWKLGDPFPIQLPGEGERRFTAEEQRAAIRKLSIPTTPAQIRAARLCGLPLDKEAVF